MSVAPKTVVYTCGVGGYDWIHRPQDRKREISYLRFSDRRGLWQHPWRHRQLPDLSEGKSPRLVTRYPKLLPHRVLPDCDVAIWVDGSIVVRDDLTPLVKEFLDSGDDIALCPHPSGRTVAEEIDHAIDARRIAPAQYEAAEQQRISYQAAGVLGAKVFECTVIFYRLGSDKLQNVCERWWHELSNYTERDQVSLPYAMAGSGIRAKHWDWHFDDPTNRFLRRVPHRPKALVKRMKTGAHFLSDTRLDYRLLHYGIKGASLIRNGRDKRKPS